MVRTVKSVSIRVYLCAKIFVKFVFKPHHPHGKNLCPSVSICGRIKIIIRGKILPTPSISP